MSSNVAPAEPPDLGREIVRAWRTLYPDADQGWRGNPGGRAGLRRAPTPEAVLMEPAFQDLLSMVRESGVVLPTATDAPFYLRLALVVGVLAGRRTGDSGGQRLAAALGGSGKPEDRRLKTLRFQALIAALDRGPDADALTALRRALKLVEDDTVDIYRLVRDLLNWKAQTRIDWTFAYYGQTARPTATSAPTPDLEEQAK